MHAVNDAPRKAGGSLFAFFFPEQKYAWGKPGDSSVVANLKAAGDKSYAVDADQPYAEMWIGTHPSGPSSLMTNSGNIGPLLKVRTHLRVLSFAPSAAGLVRRPSCFCTWNALQGSCRASHLQETCAQMKEYLNQVKYLAKFPTSQQLVFRHVVACVVLASMRRDGVEYKQVPT